MAVVCQSDGTAVHWESLQRDWIIQKCCVDFLRRCISDSVSLEVSGNEAVTAPAEGLSGDLNAEDLETPFLLM